jgi:hypothetical protein
MSVLHTTTVLKVLIHYLGGHTVVKLVEALSYNPKGHGFDYYWGYWDFLLT